MQNASGGMHRVSKTRTDVIITHVGLPQASFVQLLSPVTPQEEVLSKSEASTQASGFFVNQ